MGPVAVSWSHAGVLPALDDQRSGDQQTVVAGFVDFRGFRFLVWLHGY